MVNIAFQKSLRSKDKDKFVASLREGGMVEDKSYWEETASNIIPSGKKLLKETADMIMNPIDTAKSLYQLGSGIVQLAIPGESGDDVPEDMARAAGKYFMDRYGSLEKTKESFKNDPVGVFTEAVGAVTGLAGASKLAVKGAGKAKRAIDREIELNAIKDNLKHGDMGGNILTESTRLDISSFNPKTPHFKRDANKPVDEFLENIPLSLTTDTKYAKSYTYGNGFLYEINVPKPVLRKLFDYKNPDHIKKFKKQYIKDIKDPNNPVSKNYILAEKDAKGFVQKDPNVMYDIKRTAKDYENIADDLVETLKNSNENYLVMENPFVTHTLKKLKYKGTWQTEARDLADTGTSKFTTYRQIQLFNGKDANIKKVYNINSNEMTPRLYKGGIPTAATGIGLEEIVVKGTKKDGGGGRVSFGERGDSNIFGREYVGKEGGGSGYYDYSKEVPEGTPLTEPGSLIPAEEYTGEEEQGVLYSVDKLEDFHEEIGVNKKLLSKVLDVIASDYNLNPDALALIASTETDLHMDKISSAGARGIGQIKEIMLDDINNRADSMFDGSTFTMDDLGKDLLTDVDLMARGLKVSQHYAKYLGKNPNDFYIVSQIYKQGMDSIRNNNYDTTYDDRLTKRGNAIGVDYKNINLSNVPELQEGGTPWGGATGTIYEEPSGPKPLQQQMINAFSEGGTPQNTELEETVVTGQRGKADYPGALNNPSPILNPNYQTWQNFQNIPTDMMDFAKIGGGKDVFGQPKGTKKTEEEYDYENDPDNLYGSPVSDDTSEKVSIEEGLKNFADNIKDTFGNPEDTWEDAKEEFKIFVDNLTSKVLKKSPALAEALEMQDNNLRPFGTDVTSMAIGNMVQKYSTPEKFVTAFKNNPVGTITDIGLVALGTAAGTRTLGLGSVPFTLPLVNKYSQ